MDKSDFAIAVHYIRQDIEREIQLASTSDLPSTIHPGGGNFLAALGLLCYTEWAGKLKFAHKHPKSNRDLSSKNFEDFFDRLGNGSYATIRAAPASLDVYDRLRCGLAHEYFAKDPVTIYMLDNARHPSAIYLDTNGAIHFVVERYFGDLMHELEKLEKELFS